MMSGGRQSGWVLAISMVLQAWSAVVLAHPLEPAHVRVDFGGAERPVMAEVTTTHARDSVEPRVVPPAGCRVQPVGIAIEEDARVLKARWHCGPGGVLAVQTESGDPPVIVEIAWGGAVRAVVLDAGAPTTAFAAMLEGDQEGNAFEAFWAWVWQGAHHLWIGADHVLLVFGLVLLIGLSWRLVAALTAFTVGHSVSLGLGALEVVTLPSALVETAIAATLVWLAHGLVYRDPARPGWMARRPWLVGTAVGLIHGLGFAGVLGDLGLPEAYATLALAGFNVGLELAQLALVVGFAGILALAARLPRVLPATGPLAASGIAGHAIGIVASAWVIERAFGL